MHAQTSSDAVVNNDHPLPVSVKAWPALPSVFRKGQRLGMHDFLDVSSRATTVAIIEDVHGEWVNLRIARETANGMQESGPSWVWIPGMPFRFTT